MDRFATTSFTRQLLLQSSSFQIFVGVLDKYLETNVCKYQVPRDDKIVDHSHGITLNESTAPDTSSSTLTRAFVCSTAFYILIKSLLRLFIFQTVSNTAKFCGKGQFPYCYGNYAFSQNVHTRKLVKLRYFTQCDKFPHFRRQKRDGEAFSAKVNCLVIFPY